MRILVLADTHIPRSAAQLPTEIISAIEKSDMIVHAGDFADDEAFEMVTGMNKPLHAVCGNMDSPGLRRRLSSKKVFTVGKYKIGLIHGYGAPNDMLNTIRGEFDDVDAIIFGHSHIATNIRRDGVLFFNPGSPTDTVFAKEKTYGILEVGDKGIDGTIMRLK